MKLKRIAATLLAGIIILSGVAGTYAQAAVNSSGIVSETKQKTNSSDSNDSVWPSGPSKSNLSCDSAIVMELSTGSILYKKNIHKQHYPASITKILTSLLAIENSSLSDTVTFSESAVYGIESGSSTIYSEVGEKMSMEQCLYAIMLESANEVCLAAGEHVAGSISDFVDMMNAKVKSLGLKDTHFNNPNGLPDPDHYTSAYDMAVIARTAMQNSTFRKVCSTKSYTCAKTNKHKMTRVWNNHHQMVNGYEYPQYEYKYCIGGKTGYTTVAGSTLVTFAEKDGMELVCVIMKAGSPKQGEPNEYTDTTSLLNFGFDKYKKYTLDEENSEINSDLFNNYDSFFNSDESPIHLASESSVVLPKGVKLSEAKQKITYKKNVDIKDGENIIGQVTYTYAGKTVGSTDIIYDKTESTHLDEASREVVNNEIKDIESDNAKKFSAHKIYTGIKNGIHNGIYNMIYFATNHLFAALCILFIIIAIIFFIISSVTGWSITNRRRRGSGGYQSRGGKRKHARMQRERRKSINASKTGRRNHSKHYEKRSSSRSGNNKSSKNVNYNKRHKRTRESFGKNFFDFK